MGVLTKEGGRVYSTVGSGMTASTYLELWYTDYADKVEYQAVLKLTSTGGIIDTSIYYSIDMNGSPVNTGTGSINRAWGPGTNTFVTSSVYTVWKNAGADNVKYVTVTGNISGVGIYPGLPSATIVLTVPGIPYTTPNPPTNVSITRTSNSAVNTVNWTNNPTGGGPYTAISVTTSPLLDGFPVQLAGTTSSLTSILTVPDSKVRYSVTALNNNHKSTSTLSSNWTATAPRAPTDPSVSRLTLQSIKIKWVNRSNTYTHIQIWHSENGGGWQNLTEAGELSAGTASYTHTSASYQTSHRYIIVAVVRIDGYEWRSADLVTDLVKPIVPPEKPFDLTPNSVLSVADALTFSWKHYSTDDSIQTAFQLEWRSIGSSTWLTTSPAVITSNASTYTFMSSPFAAGTEYEWRVRTWGMHPDPSQWETVMFLAKSPPVVSNVVISPHDDVVSTTVVGPDITVSWSYNNMYGDVLPASYKIGIFGTDGVTLLHQETGTSNTTATVHYTLENNMSYVVTVYTTDTTGLQSVPVSTTITVQYDSPPVAEVTTSFFGDRAAVELSISNDMSQLIKPEVNWVLRKNKSDPESAWKLLSSTVAVNSSWIDNDPPLGIEVLYKIITYSTVGTFSETTITVHETNPHYLSWFSVGSLYVSFCANPKVSITYEREKVLHSFAGRTKPIAFIGKMRKRELSITGTFDLATPSSSPDIMERIIDSGEPILYRDCFGNRFYCAIRSFKYDQRNMKIVDFSIDLSEVDYVE